MSATRPRTLWLPIAAAIVAALLFVADSRAEPTTVGVAVLRGVAWSPGAHVREGAGEFEVLLRVAQLQRAHRMAGLVTVGDHNGMFLGGGERALLHVALSGVPVVKLARNGEVAATPDGVFLDAGRLTEEQATRVLTRCLELHGAPPAAANPQRPTKRELAAIRAHLQPFQDSLTKPEGRLVALR